MLGRSVPLLMQLHHLHGGMQAHGCRLTARKVQVKGKAKKKQEWESDGSDAASAGQDSDGDHDLIKVLTKDAPDERAAYLRQLAVHVYRSATRSRPCKLDDEHLHLMHGCARRPRHQPARPLPRQPSSQRLH